VRSRASFCRAVRLYGGQRALLFGCLRVCGGCRVHGDRRNDGNIACDGATIHNKDLYSTSKTIINFWVSLFHLAETN
jgi:hypothetical protein